jgi:hypothetical protein
MKKRLLLLLLIFFSGTSFAIFSAMKGEECTTAVITGLATSDAAPLLWKNRDTDQLSNKVVFVNDKPYSYLALVNAEDTSGRMAWTGLNSAGFAIMNSVAYNLPSKSSEAVDLEGIIMADALRTCSTVDDFESYIKSNLGPDLGSRANFGVIDAHEGASLFEVHNRGYKRLDAKDFPEKYIVNTNFSRSGTEDQGRGYIRFDRASALFKNVAQGKLTLDFILENVCRDLGHPLLTYPAPEEWKNLPADKPYWIHANYTIDRVSTSSAVVIRGVGKGENSGKVTMWVILGEPVCSIAVPLWVEAGNPPSPLWEGKDAPICKEALRIKDILRPLKGSDRKEYIDITRLDNKAGKGWLPLILRAEKEIIEKTREFLGRNPNSSQLAEFEKEMATKVLETLKGIH